MRGVFQRFPAQGGSSMKSSRSLVLLNVLVVATCLMAMKGQAASQELPDASALREPSAPVSGGMRVHIDPQTGRFTTKPGAGIPMQLSPAEVNALSTSHHGLVEALSPRQRGGVFINLQGRFQSPLVATVDEAGKVTIRHLDADPLSIETK
jgi:hypothetical protein